MATAMVPRMTMERLTVAVCVLAAVMTTPTASAVQDPLPVPEYPDLPTTPMVPVDCEPCRSVTERANHVAWRMNELAKHYNGFPEGDPRRGWLQEETSLLRRWLDLKRELGELDGYRMTCEEKYCPEKGRRVRPEESSQAPPTPADTPTANSGITKPLVIAGAGVVLIGGAAALSGGKDAPAPGDTLPDLSSFLGNYTIDFRINGCGRVDNSQVNGTLTPNTFIKNGLPFPGVLVVEGPNARFTGVYEGPISGFANLPDNTGVHWAIDLRFGAGQVQGSGRLNPRTGSVCREGYDTTFNGMRR